MRYELLSSNFCLVTDGQTDRQTDGQTDRQTDRQTESKAYEPTEQMDRWAKKIRLLSASRSGAEFIFLSFSTIIISHLNISVTFFTLFAAGSVTMVLKQMGIQFFFILCSHFTEITGKYPMNLKTRKRETQNSICNCICG